MDENELKVQQKQTVVHSGETTKPGPYFVPAVDIYESEQEVVVLAEMPGVSGDSIDISLEDSVLTINGLQEPESPDAAKILLQEFQNGNFQRRFTVAESIDQDQISATMLNGILKITLPKTAKTQPRKIEVRIE